MVEKHALVEPEFWLTKDDPLHSHSCGTFYKYLNACDSSRRFEDVGPIGESEMVVPKEPEVRVSDDVHQDDIHFVKRIAVAITLSQTSRHSPTKMSTSPKAGAILAESPTPYETIRDGLERRLPKYLHVQRPISSHGRIEPLSCRRIDLRSN